MKRPKVDTGSVRTEFSKWLGRVFLALLFVAIPTALYFTYYVGSKTSDRIVSSFRALDDASIRLNEVLANLEQLADNHPVAPKALRLVDDLVQKSHERSPVEGMFAAEQDKRLFEYKKELAAEREELLERMSELESQLSEQYQLEYSAGPIKSLERRVKDTKIQLDSQTRRIAEWNAAYLPRLELCAEATGLAEYARYAADSLEEYIESTNSSASAIGFVTDVVVKKRELVDESASYALQCTTLYQAIRNSALESGAAIGCESDRLEISISHKKGDPSVVLTDCRAPGYNKTKLFEAMLENPQSKVETSGSEVAVQKLLATSRVLATQLTFSMSDLAKTISSNLSGHFNQFMIVDDEGDILYESEGTAEAESNNPKRYNRSLNSSAIHINHINVVGLIRGVQVNSRPSDASTLMQGEVESGAADSSVGIHSRISDFRAAGTNFRALIHPVQTSLPAHSQSEPGGRRSSSVGLDQRGAPLYLIGIVSEKKLRSDSLRLRQSVATDAVLLLVLLASALSLLWLWTAGPRLSLSYRQFLLLYATGILTCSLVTLYAYQYTARAFDSYAFDRVLESISNSISIKFEQDIFAKQTALSTTLIDLRKELEDESTENDGSAASMRSDESSKEAAYWCYQSKYEPFGVRLPEFESAFLLDQKGWQSICATSTGVRSPRVNLWFRNYFKVPYRNQAWDLSSASGVGKRADETNDWTLGTSRKSDPLPIYISRITSILDGAVETVISAPAFVGDNRPSEEVALTKGADRASSEEPQVVAMVTRLSSLEDSVLPPLFGYLLAENSSGRILYHSDNDRALATNIYREIDNNVHLEATIKAKSVSSVFSTTYNGQPVRAHVSPLHESVPWTLMVYRSHELEDTASSMLITRSAMILYPIVGVLFLLTVYTTRTGNDSPSKQIRRERLSGLFRARRTLFYTTVAYLLMVCGILVAKNRPDGFLSEAAYLSPLYLVLFGSVLFALVFRFNTRKRSKRVVMPTTRSVNQVVLLVMLNVAVIPTFAIATHVRSDLGRGYSSVFTNEIVLSLESKVAELTQLAQRFPYLNASIAEEINCYSETSRGLTRCASGFEPDGELELGDALGLTDRGWPTNSDTGVVAEQKYKVARDEIERRMDTDNHSVSQNPLNRLLNTRSAESLFASSVSARATTSVKGWQYDSPSVAAFALTGSSLVRELGGVHPGVPLIRLGISLLTLPLAIALVLFVTYSISYRVLATKSKRMFARGTGGSITKLIGMPRKGAPPKRLLVLHQSEDLCRREIKQAKLDFRTVIELSLAGDKLIATQPISGAPDGKISGHETLVIVYGVEQFLQSVDLQRRLIEELDAANAADCSILLFSRVDLLYWLACFDDHRLDRSLGAVETGLVSLWGRVLALMDVRRWEEPGQAVGFSKEVEERLGNIGVPESNSLFRYLQSEVCTFPRLTSLGASVYVRYAGLESLNGHSAVKAAHDDFASAASGYYSNIWLSSTPQEQLQLVNLAVGGFANPNELTTISSLVNRGLVTDEEIPRLRSMTFGQYVLSYADHSALIAWTRVNSGSVWKSLWPPLVILGALLGAFFLHSNPDAAAPIAAVVAAALGLFPVIAGSMRNFRSIGESFAGGAADNDTA